MEELLKSRSLKSKYLMPRQQNHCLMNCCYCSESKPAEKSLADSNMQAIELS